MTNEPRYSKTTMCNHCGNEAPMVVGAQYSQVREHENSPGGWTWAEGPVFEIWVCPACDEVSLARSYWHDGYDSPDFKPEIVYPKDGESVPLGLPPELQKEFIAAVRVRRVSPNAYGVLLGRLLELVCNDRGAIDGNLGARLNDLASRDEIPTKLVKVGQKLQELRHVGAHAFLGELGPAEVPILDSLCRAILEYVYTAPQLVDRAENSLKSLRARERKKKGRVKKSVKKVPKKKTSTKKHTAKNGQ